MLAGHASLNALHLALYRSCSSKLAVFSSLLLQSILILGCIPALFQVIWLDLQFVLLILSRVQHLWLKASFSFL